MSDATTDGGRESALLRLLWKAAKLLATVALTFLGLLVVTFLIGRVVPVDPVLAVIGDRAPKSVYDRVFVELGLDRPLYEQFWIYLHKVFTGDFGVSMRDKASALQRLSRLEGKTVGTQLDGFRELLTQMFESMPG